MRVLLGTIAALAVGTASAVAADLPVRKAPAPVVAPVWSWNGFYIGINGGYSWGRAGRDITFFNPVTGAAIIPPVGSGSTSDANLDGGVFGGQIGYNWQTANWVFGIETDAQWSGQRGTASAVCGATPVIGGPCLPGFTAVPAGIIGTVANVEQKLEWFGTFRGRAGFAVMPSLLLYATGGAAYGSIKTNLGLAGFTPNGTPVAIAGSSSDTRLGWTVGGGIEGKFAPNWSAKVEYLYMDLGSVSSTAVFPTAAGVPPIGVSLNSRITDNIIRGGINYHFSAGPY